MEQYISYINTILVRKYQSWECLKAEKINMKFQTKPYRKSFCRMIANAPKGLKRP